MSKLRNSQSTFVLSLFITLLPILAFLAYLSTAVVLPVEAATNFDFALVTNESDTKAGYFNDAAEFRFVLTNKSSGTITVELSESLPTDFTVNYSLGSSVELTENQSREFTASINTPNSATAEQVYDNIDISATQGGETETVDLTIVVLNQGDIGVDISGGTPPTGARGETVEIDYVVQNDGASTSDYAADFTFRATSQLGYSLAIAEGGNTASGSGTAAITISDLEPGETANVTVDVTIPSNAVTGTRDRITVVAVAIIDTSVTDSFDTNVNVQNPVPTNTSPPVTYADEYEPNDTLQTATSLPINTNQCDHTFWPVGDKDFFKFATTAGLQYVIETDVETGSAGIDPFMQLYDPRGNPGVTNDNLAPGAVDARIGFIAGETAFTYVSVSNVSPLDSTGKEYCIRVTETLVTPTLTPTPTKTPTNTLTATPTPTLTPTATLLGDGCEPNENAQQACSILPGEQVTGDFANPFGTVTDQDFYKLLAVKRNVIYSCSTSDLAPGVDTRLELRNQRYEWLGDNDDREPNNPSSGSEVTIQARESGIIYVIVRPFTAPPVDEAELYTYKLACVALVPTATPLPTETLTPTATPIPTETPLPPPTNTPAPSWTPTSNAVVPPSTPRPIVPTQRPVSTATSQLPTETPLPTATPFMLPTPTPTPRVIVNPIPTVTPAVTTPTNVTLDVLLYYDINNNFTPEANEGVMDVAVAIYDNLTGDLLAYGTTNANGMVTFPNLTPTGNALRVSIPFLNFNQVVAASIGTMQVRIAPQRMPNTLP